MLPVNAVVAKTVEALTCLGRVKEAVSLSLCGSMWRVFVSACGSTHLVKCSCDHPLCPKCNRERSRPLQNKVMVLTRGKGVFRFLTLTVVSVPYIHRDYVDWLIKCFAKLRKVALWSFRVHGGVYSIESTHNRYTGQWHVHLHVIIGVGSSLPQRWIYNLRAEWMRVTGGAGCVIHMRAVNRRAIRELVKYQAKAVTLLHDPALIDEYLRAFRNVRRLQCFGTFLGVDVPEPEHKPWKCMCGLCRPEDWRYQSVVPEAETFEASDGSRQLLFDFEVRFLPKRPPELSLVERLTAEAVAKGLIIPQHGFDFDLEGVSYAG